MKAEAVKARFGEVREISAEDYVEHVKRAGEGVWVVLHLFKQGWDDSGHTVISVQ